MQCWI